MITSEHSLCSLSSYASCGPAVRKPRWRELCGFRQRRKCISTCLSDGRVMRPLGSIRTIQCRQRGAASPLMSPSSESAGSGPVVGTGEDEGSSGTVEPCPSNFALGTDCWAGTQRVVSEGGLEPPPPFGD